MVWIFVIIIVGFILFKFLFDLDKDNSDLGGKSLDEKFNVIVKAINNAAYEGQGEVNKIDKRSFNLYQRNSNQIINFHYSTGTLSITWKYKYYQKEVVHKEDFNDVRNLSLFEQQKIADKVIYDMARVIENHKNNVMKDF